ncbi:hypothetical protein T440DRAFT_508935 [Plenodomus tracheiphilus IPT5]|uniref:Carbohydrate-binding module family 18 protein n=1 Tax=Plenodomus tracheiphilus IPT5 TaxID=1408161 RepID=A0A6A7B1Y0_9PLEO|nr:hypothetical protein T440DRAFT_508935 [Plenodomus tracheiphilus IPT5]
MRGLLLALSVASSAQSANIVAIATTTAGTFTTETSTRAAWHSWWSAATVTEIQYSPTWFTTTTTATTTILPNSPPSIKTSWRTITVTANSNNPSAPIDYVLYPPSTSLPTSFTTLPDVSTPTWVTKSASSLSTSRSVRPTTSVRSPSLFPPNGLANSTSCRCVATAPRGMYCGYCSQIKTCKRGSSCWAGMFSCGDGCKDYGWNSYCGQAARVTHTKANCPIQW